MDYELASQTIASWNPLAEWLQSVDKLRRAGLGSVGPHIGALEDETAKAIPGDDNLSPTNALQEWNLTRLGSHLGVSPRRKRRSGEGVMIGPGSSTD